LEPAETPQSRIGNPKSRIIVADDNADMRHYLTRLLRERYEVTPVANGKAALEAARERVPDLVLTDVMMPELDGFGLLQSLRKDVRTATVPVVLLSARAGEESRVEGMEAGADDYLIKPFSARELLARVSARLEISRLRREAAAQQEAAYEAVRASEERLEAFFNSTSVGAAVLLPSARFILVNDAFCRIVGYSRDELISLGCADIMHDDDFSGMKELFDDLMAGGKNAVVAEKRYRRKDGAVIWLQNSVALTRDAAGQPLHLVVLSQDVTDRRRAEEALREADRRKDEFIAMLGHELRNPLGIISNGVQVLKRIAPREPQLDDVEEMIERQVTHTSRLLDDLLDISRIAQGKIQLDKKRQSLDEIVRQTLTDHSGAFEERNIRLRADIPQRTLWVMADSTRIAQAFGNLLANAVKFTETNGTVTVKLRTEMDDAVLSVRDTGIGIESGMLGRIFETFIQADRSLERTRGGLGLGLALVKGIVELHGGRVMASSDGPGSGSEFTIRLPLDHSPSIHAPAVPDSNVSVRGYRILLIEDNPIAARSTRLLLEQSGHTVEVAHDGANGVETARRFRPEIVLCDIGLPGMDGYRVAETLRLELGNDGAYLIALSGYAQNDGRAPKAGFNAHLTKPLDFAQLEKMLAALAVKPRDPHGSSEAEARAGRSTV
jgi:PAS domain S-box-containing protein